jgi:hypothetical protein
MNIERAKYLWSSQSVRRALKKECFRLLLFMTLYLGTTVVIRYIREKPIREAVFSVGIGLMVVILAWLVSCVRTLRAVLREHGMLHR